MLLLLLLLLLPRPKAAATPVQPLLMDGRRHIEHFAWYWAMQDGSSNPNGTNGRNCSAPRPCSWDHANADFVQNSYVGAPVSLCLPVSVCLGLSMCISLPPFLPASLSRYY